MQPSGTYGPIYDFYIVFFAVLAVLCWLLPVVLHATVPVKKWGLLLAYVVALTGFMATEDSFMPFEKFTDALSGAVILTVLAVTWYWRSNNAA